MWRTTVYFCEHWYPCWGLRMTCTSRVDQSSPTCVRACVCVLRNLFVCRFTHVTCYCVFSSSCYLSAKRVLQSVHRMFNARTHFGFFLCINSCLVFVLFLFFSSCSSCLCVPQPYLMCVHVCMRVWQGESGDQSCSCRADVEAIAQSFQVLYIETTTLDRYYAETVLGGYVKNQEWTPEIHWNVIVTHHLKQFQDLENGDVTHFSLFLVRCIVKGST